MEYSEEYLAESRAPLIIGVNSMFLVTSVIAVSLRFYARRMTGAGFWVRTPYSGDDNN
jgi:hypothetical protein